MSSSCGEKGGVLPNVINHPSLCWSHSADTRLWEFWVANLKSPPKKIRYIYTVYKINQLNKYKKNGVYACIYVCIIKIVEYYSVLHSCRDHFIKIKIFTTVQTKSLKFPNTSFIWAEVNASFKKVNSKEKSNTVEILEN